MKRDVADPELFRLAVVRWEDRADGSVVSGSGYPFDPYLASTVEVLAARARGDPERPLVAQWEVDGRRLLWGEEAIRVEAVAGDLAERGVAGRPVMILTSYSVEHLLLILAG
jgi:feruloyl-CoA synthase